MVLQYKSISRVEGIQQQGKWIQLQIKRKQAPQPPKEDSFFVSNRQSYEIITIYFNTQNNEYMKNAISYIVPKTRLREPKN